MRTRAHARLYWPTVAWLNERTRHHAIDLRRTVAASPQRAAAPSTGGAAARDAADPAVPEPGLADAPRVRGRGDRAAPAPGVRAARAAVGRQADHRRGGRERRGRRAGLGPARAARRARARHRARARGAPARVIAAREPARRPVLEPHVRAADGARRDARPRALRGP